MSGYICKNCEELKHNEDVNFYLVTIPGNPLITEDFICEPCFMALAGKVERDERPDFLVQWEPEGELVSVRRLYAKGEM